MRQMFFGLLAIVGHPVARGRYAVALHELLGVRFARLQARAIAIRTEHCHAVAAQRLAYPGRKRSLRTDDGEPDRLGLGALRQRSPGRRRDVRPVRSEQSSSGIAGSGEDVGHLARLLELPSQRVLARTGPDHEDFHSHSIVAGGLVVMSYTTLLTSGTSLTMRVEMRSSSSCGSLDQSAVMPSSLDTARMATRLP